MKYVLKRVVITTVIAAYAGSASGQIACPETIQEDASLLVTCVQSLTNKIRELEGLINQPHPSFELTGTIIEMQNEGTLKTIVLGANRFCALSNVGNNNHTNQACSCDVKQEAGAWVLSIKNQTPELYCACGATCIK